MKGHAVSAASHSGGSNRNMKVKNGKLELDIAFSGGQGRCIKTGSHCVTLAVLQHYLCI